MPLVTSVGNSICTDCTNLISVKLPLVKSATSSLFSGCKNLISVDVSSLNYISPSMFYNCHSIKAIIIQQEEKICSNTNLNSFNGCYHILGTSDSTYNPNGDKDGYFYVPDSLLEDYKSATNWSKYATQIKGLSELPQEYKDLYNIEV